MYSKVNVMLKLGLVAIGMTSGLMVLKTILATPQLISNSALVSSAISMLVALFGLFVIVVFEAIPDKHEEEGSK